MIILYGVAFISGLFTILAPCIWPLLPIVLADVTQSNSKRRPLGITAGVAISFAFFTLAISALESSLGFSPNVLRKMAVIVLLVIGISMVVPDAWKLPSHLSAVDLGELERINEATSLVVLLLASPSVSSGLHVADLFWPR